MVKGSVPTLLLVVLGTVPAWAGEDLSPPPPPASPFRDFKPATPESSDLLGPLPALESGRDGRRTMGRFVPNLGRNLAGFLSPRNASALALGATVAGTGALIDQPAHRYFADQPRAPELGRMGQRIGGVGIMAPMALGLFAAGRASHDTRFRAATYDLGQAMIVTQVYTTGLKMAIGRTRPDSSNRLSFPSGHTSSAFTVATVAHHYYGRRAGIAGFTAAGLIGLSRMERDKHHASDVLAGAAIGWISARTVIHQNGALPSQGRRLSLAPVAPPSGSGVGLGVSLDW